MRPRQRWRGLWRNVFEDSRFCPEPARTCDHNTPGDRIWLSDGPGPARPGRTLQSRLSRSPDDVQGDVRAHGRCPTMRSSWRSGELDEADLGAAAANQSRKGRNAQAVRGDAEML